MNGSSHDIQKFQDSSPKSAVFRVQQLLVVLPRNPPKAERFPQLCVEASHLKLLSKKLWCWMDFRGGQKEMKLSTKLMTNSVAVYIYIYILHMNLHHTCIYIYSICIYHKVFRIFPCAAPL